MTTFTEIPYRQYPYSYINGVSLFINYLPDAKVLENMVDTNLKFKDYLNRIFGVKFKEDFLPQVFNANIFRNNKSQRITFLRNYIIISLDFNAYENFTQSVIPVLYQLKFFFENIMNVKIYSHIGLSKVNGWELTPDEGEVFDIKTARGIILSDRYIKTATETSALLPENDFPLLILKEQIEDSTGSTIDVRITSSCNLPPTGEKDYSLNIVTSLEKALKNTISFEEMREQFFALNRTQYNAFHWVVSDDIIKLMKGELV